MKSTDTKNQGKFNDTGMGKKETGKGGAPTQGKLKHPYQSDETKTNR